jgi:hypothetical protein
LGYFWKNWAIFSSNLLVILNSTALFNGTSLLGRYDIQHNDTQHNDILHNGK